MKIELQQVSFSRGQSSLVENISLELEDGETVVLLGPNGAGKSTLLRLIAGYLTPTRGNVLVNDKPVGSWNLAERAAMLGVLTQRNTLDFPFTVREVVSLGLLQPTGRTCTVESLLEQLSLQADRIYTDLSGGEKQLVQLARVLAQINSGGQSAYLLLDEPMSALDLKHQQVVAGLLGGLAQSGTGQLIVMHDINMASDVADRVVLMSKGSIVAAGVTDQVLTADNLQHTFDVPVRVTEQHGIRSFHARLSGRGN